MVSLGRAVAVAAVLAWSVLPILFAIISSFKPSRQIFDYPPTVIFNPTLDHYRDLLHNWPTFLQNLTNSLIVTVAATLLATGSLMNPLIFVEGGLPRFARVL